MTLRTEEAESALIGRLLLDPRQLPIVAGTLQPEDFGAEVYGDYFRGMLRLQAEGKPIDILTLKQALDGDTIEIDPLELTSGHHGPVEEYAEIIRNASRRRILIRELEHVQAIAQSGAGDPVAELEQAVSKILERSSGDDATLPEVTSKTYLEALMQRQRGDDPGLTYGIPGMDDLLLPARKGRLILLAARPSVGKTAMAESISDHWARQDRGPVLFASLEMDAEELMDRAMARETGVSSEAISRGTLDPKSLESVMDAAARRATTQVHILDEGAMTTSRIRAAAARLKMRNEGRLAGVVIDYTQLLEDRSPNGGNDNTRVAAISRAMKQMARALKCPVLAMSQLNRNIEMERRRPRLSDLRDSGALEQDGDVVMILEGRPDTPNRTVYVLKQRQGRVGDFTVRFDGSTQTWHEPGPWSLGETQAVAEAVAGSVPVEEAELGW